MYVYKKTEQSWPLPITWTSKESYQVKSWTVGYYKPDGTWVPESDHPTPEEAAKRVAWLNGSTETVS